MNHLKPLLAPSAAALLLAGSIVPAALAATPASEPAEEPEAAQGATDGASRAEANKDLDLDIIPSSQVITAEQLHALPEMNEGEGREEEGRPAEAAPSEDADQGEASKREDGTEPEENSTPEGDADQGEPNLDPLIEGGFALIDIRSLADFSTLHIPGASCLPAGRVFEIRVREVPDDQNVVLVGQDGSRLAETWQTLMDNGYDPERVWVVEDGMDAWFEAGYPTIETPMRSTC